MLTIFAIAGILTFLLWLICETLYFSMLIIGIVIFFAVIIIAAVISSFEKLTEKEKEKISKSAFVIDDRFY